MASRGRGTIGDADSRDDDFDEGPSDADIERFSDEEALCPDCGAAVWDGAEICPKCHAWIGGGSGVRSPSQRWWRNKWAAVLVALLVLALLGVLPLLLRR